MNHLSVYLGIEKDGNGRQLNPLHRAEAMVALRALAVRRFGGYTLTHCQGVWLGPDGLVEEGAVKLDIFTYQPRAYCVSFTREAGELFGQASVLMDYTLGAAQFVELDVKTPKLHLVEELAS
jgi:hypothetical protein